MAPRSCSAPAWNSTRRSPRTPAVAPPLRRCAARSGASASCARTSRAACRCARRGARAGALSALRRAGPSRRGPRHRKLHVEQRLEVVHAVLAEVVGRDAGDHGHVGARDREPAPQDAAARGLEDRRLGVRRRAARVARRPGRSNRRCRARCRRRTRRPCSSSRSRSPRPCAQAASRRTTVVLPLVPVTSAVGIARSTPRSTAAGAGSSASCQLRRPRPRRASVFRRRAARAGRATARPEQCAQARFASRAARRLSRISAPAVSSTGGCISSGCSAAGHR